MYNEQKAIKNSASAKTELLQDITENLQSLNRVDNELRDVLQELDENELEEQDIKEELRPNGAGNKAKGHTSYRA